MVFNNRKASLRHLLLVIYVFAIILLCFLLIREKQGDASPFSLSRVALASSQGSAVVSISGEDFHSEIQVVSARSFVNEDALLWRTLSNVRTKAIDLKNDIALVASAQNKLVSIRINGDQSPTVLDSIDIHSPIRQILIVGDQALLALQRHAGFSLVDLQDPKSMQIVANYPMAGMVTAMVADRNMVYFTDVFRGLGRINLASGNPTPEIIDPMDSPWRIDLQNKKLVVATVKGNVKLFNLSQEGPLLEVGSFDNQHNVRGVAFVNDSLVITLADNSLRVYNLSLWPRLENPAILELPGHPLLLERTPDQASVVVSLIAGGMALVDIANPEMPALSGSLLIPKTFLGMSLYAGSLLTISRDGLEMFSLDKVIGGENALMAKEALIDLENYTLQTWNDQVYGYGNNRQVYFGKKPLSEAHSPEQFMAIAEENIVYLLEPDSDGSLQRVGSLEFSGAARDVLTTSNRLYVLHQAGLGIFSGSRSDELVVTGGLPLAGEPQQLEMMDSGYLLVATRDDGVLVVDVNDPKKPRLVSDIVQPKHLQSVNIVQDLLADGQRVYIAQGKGGVHVIDMSTPSHPELIQVIPTEDYAKSMVLHDNLLLVADGSKGLFMIDVRDSATALIVGSLATPLRIDQLAVEDDGLIASSHPGGTMRLHLPERVKAAKRTGGEIRLELGKVEAGQYLYLYDDKGSQQVQVRM